LILTVTLNPAVDRTCRVECLAPGRVNRMKSVHSVAGGKGINVARVLRSFHMPAAAAGFLGGSGGRFIEKSMEEAGIECHFTKIRVETRTNTNILGEDGAVTELLEPGPPVTEKELAQFRKQFLGCLERCGTVVLSGSAPEGVPEKDYYLAIALLDHSYWIIGSALGFLLGSALSINTTGVDFAMTALFVVIAVGQWRGTKNHLPAAIGCLATLLSLQLVGKDNMLILALAMIAALLLALQRRMPADE